MNYEKMASLVIEEKARHDKVWTNNGFDRITAYHVDLNVVEKILELLGKLPQLKVWLEGKYPNISELDNFVLILQGAVEVAPGKVLPIPNALLVANPREEVEFVSSEDGMSRDIDDGIKQGCFIWAISSSSREELCSKVLAGAGLVPYRHGQGLPIDVDRDGLYWIKWDDKDKPVLEDA